MPYPSSFLRLTALWLLPDGEVANASISWAPSSPLTSLDDATATALAARLTTAWTGFKGRYASTTFFHGSSVSWINTTGKVLARIDKPVTPVAGTSTANPLPNECAAVVSLRTATAGRRTRGRMYWPNPATDQMTTNARWISAFTDGLSVYMKAVCEPLTVGAETFTSVVASATGSLLTPVTAVAVGDVPDAQRRRRDKQFEAYTVQAL